jgi:hypothetical protein
MGDPVTAALIVGTGAEIYGTFAGAQAAKNEAKFQAKVLQNNQKLAKEQAKDIVTRGQIGARELEADAIRFADDQLLAFAGRGIDITSEVAVAAVEETARITAADIITLQHGVANDVWATEVGIAGLETEEALARARARNIGRAANIALFSSILTGGADIKLRTSQLPGGS